MTARMSVAMPDIAGGDSAVDALTIGTTSYTGPLKLLSAGEAQRLTQHIKLTASGVRNGLFKLRNLIEEAKRSNVWNVLGFASWTAYLADTLAEEPMRVSRDERLELVAYLAGEGLSTRAIAPIVGVSKDTVQRDIARVSNETPDPALVETATDVGASAPVQAVTPVESPAPGVTVDPTTGEVSDDTVTVTEHTVTEKVKTITGLDGKTYTHTPRVKPAEDVAQVNAETESKALGRALMTLSGMKHPAHRNRIITEWWPSGNDAVPPDSRALFEPTAIRDIAAWLLRLADELEGTS